MTEEEKNVTRKTATVRKGGSEKGGGKGKSSRQVYPTNTRCYFGRRVDALRIECTVNVSERGGNVSFRNRFNTPKAPSTAANKIRMVTGSGRWKERDRPCFGQLGGEGEKGWGSPQY